MSILSSVAAVNLTFYDEEKKIIIQSLIEQYLLPIYLIDEVYFTIENIVCGYQIDLMFEHPEEPNNPFFSPEVYNPDKSSMDNRNAMYKKAKEELEADLTAIQRTQQFLDNSINQKLLKGFASLPFEEVYMVLDLYIKRIDEILKGQSKGGRRHMRARKMLLSKIKEMWEKYTEKDATSDNPHHLTYHDTPFTAFAKAVALPILCKDDRHGIDTALEECVKERFNKKALKA